MSNSIVGIAGCKEHLNIGSSRAQGVGHFFATHYRHDNVGENQINFTGVMAREAKPFFAVARINDGVTLLPQSVYRELAHVGFVLDQEYGFGASDSLEACVWSASR